MRARKRRKRWMRVSPSPKMARGHKDDSLLHVEAEVLLQHRLHDTQSVIGVATLGQFAMGVDRTEVEGE